ncbi:hypothetical protein HBH61_056070 [Parastagonospora nodorum]|nr:hypothetical protein HBH61_056070 [Parastagonospora nodorum]KAH4939092.1 hypothetical protein HBI79_046450 [Parastagonospora nodorum]KAH5099357.1 hypothetical protein HBH72_108830 [Parastagonospora nodorum]
MANSQPLHQPLVVATDTAATVNDFTAAQTDDTLRERLVDGLKHDQFYLFDRMLTKGIELHQMMLADSAAAGQMFNPPQANAESIFQSAELLSSFDYVEDLSAPREQSLTILKISLVLESLGMDPCFASSPPEDDKEAPGAAESESSGSSIAITHDLLLENWGPEDCSIPPSAASFKQVINPKDGIIVAYDNYSPRAAAEDSARNDTIIPDLKHWSDIAFLQWKSCASKGAELKYMLRYQVMNDSANYMIEALNFANGDETVEWPGTTYDGASEEGQASLGTPNGSGVAWLLIQHKEFLGHKIVDKITIFHKNLDMMLLFHIADVEAEGGSAEAYRM